jgi:hypothetical protein
LVPSGVSVFTDEMTEGSQDAGFTVSLDWNRDAGNTRIVVADIQYPARHDV